MADHTRCCAAQEQTENGTVMHGEDKAMPQHHEKTDRFLE